jgi:hypothetical protein
VHPNNPYQLSPDSYPWPPLAVQEPLRRRSRAPLFITLAVVVFLLLGGGAFAGAWVWYGLGTTEPEEALPSSVSAFARIDLSPGLGQLLKLNNLAKKFPDAGQDTEEALKRFNRELLDSVGLKDIDYDTDIKPWFDNRFGVALWDHGNARECSLLALASKDDALAGAALAKEQKSLGKSAFGVAMFNGYAIVAQCRSNSQEAAETAVAAARTESLAQQEEFARGFADFPSGQAVVAWTDLTALVDDLRGAPVSRDLNPLGELVGQVLIGAQATDSGVDVRFRFASTEKAPAGPRDVGSMVDSLPANSIVAGAFSLRGAGPLGRAIEKQLGALDQSSGADAQRVSDAIKAALSAAVSLSVTDLDGTDPGLKITALAASAADGGRVADLFDGLKKSGTTKKSNQWKVHRDGAEVTLTTDGYQPGPGTLRDSALYREATSDTSGTTTSLIYVDLQRWLAGMDLSADAKRDLAPLKAAAMSMGYDGDDAVGLLRIVVK